MRPHHRIKMPDSLAIFAALLLLIGAVAGFDANPEANSPGQQTIISAESDNSGNRNINHTTKEKSGGLNFGLLLFRRG